MRSSTCLVSGRGGGGIMRSGSEGAGTPSVLFEVGSSSIVAISTHGTGGRGCGGPALCLIKL